jgi:protein LTV1
VIINYQKTNKHKMGRKKKFIEKEEGHKFYLVHRSQRDPLYLDETLGEHVLVPVDPENEANHKLADTLNGLTFHQLSGKSRKEMEDAKKKRVEEQQKFGVYYDDDYNYLQHLREVDHTEDTAEMEEAKATAIKIGSVIIKGDDEEDTRSVASSSKDSAKLQLPSSVFASKFEEEVGYFNQAAPNSDPKINWDPEIVKLLDEDVEIDFDDPENQLEDDFFEKANGGEDEDDEDDDEDDEDDDDNDDDDEDTLTENSDNEGFGGRSDREDDEYSESRSVKEFETKSRFSNYSMTSSVVRRNEGLKYIDQHFEKFYEQYDTDQIGALDTEDIEGKIKKKKICQLSSNQHIGVAPSFFVIFSKRLKI